MITINFVGLLVTIIVGVIVGQLIIFLIEKRKNGSK